MKSFKPSNPRYVIDRTEQSVIITISSDRNIFLVLWLSLFLCWWFCFFSGLGVGWGFFAILSIAPFKGGQVIFPLIFFIFMSAIQIFHLWLGFSAISRLLWTLFGIERVEVDKFKLIISKEIFGWKKPAIYSLEKIKNATAISKIGIFSRKFISFDYEGKIYRFGYRLTPNESQEVVSAIEEFISFHFN